METLRPLANRVLIDRDVPGDRLGMILLPDRYREKPQAGTVLAIGEQVDAKQIKVGSRVLFGHWSGTEAHLGEHDRRILITQDEVLATVLDSP